MPHATALSLDDALARFETQLVADRRSHHTIGSYRRHLATLRLWLATERVALRIDAITPGLLHRFVSSPLVTLRTDGAPRKPGSVATLAMAVKAFFVFLARTDALSSNPAAFLRVARGRRVPPEILTDEERRRLGRAIARMRTPRARRDAMIVELMLATGLRLGSVVGLDVADVRLSECALVVRRLKGGGQSRKFLAPRLAAHLAAYVRRRTRTPSHDPALFLSNQGRRICARHLAWSIEEWARAAGIEHRVTPHMLRHTFASRLYAKTRDLLVVQRALDHAHAASSEIYTHVSDRALESALRRL